VYDQNLTRREMAMRTVCETNAAAGCGVSYIFVDLRGIPSLAGTDLAGGRPLVLMSEDGLPRICDGHDLHMP
jgi:hypothetical protein